MGLVPLVGGGSCSRCSKNGNGDEEAKDADAGEEGQEGVGRAGLGGDGRGFWFSRVRSDMGVHPWLVTGNQVRVIVRGLRKKPREIVSVSEGAVKLERYQNGICPSYSHSVCYDVQYSC